MRFATDLDAVANLIYDTDEYLFPFIFGPRWYGLPVLKRLIALDNNSFSHRFIECLVEGDEVQAILIGYDHRTIDETAEEADYQIALSAFDRLLLVPKFWILQPILGKEEVTGVYIQNLCVAAAHRGKGLGSRLIRHFIETHPVDVWLDVELSNDAALRFYERLGFQIVSRKDVFIKGLGNYRLVRRPGPFQ
ncbi:MAG: N-acetyltransferase [Turneriella sp.]